MMFRTRILVIFLICIVAWEYTYAENAPSAPAITIGARIDGNQGGGESGYTGLFLKSLRVELQLAGLKLTDAENPNVLILGYYELQHDAILFNLSAEVPERGIILCTTSADEQLRLELDTVLLDHARILTQAIAVYAESMVPQISSQAPEVNLIQTAHSDSELTEESSLRSVEVGPESAAAVHAALQVSEKKSWMFSTDMGMYIPGGEGGRYLKAGYTPGLFAGYFISPGRALGLSLETMFFLADGYAVDAKGWVFSLGPGIRLKSGTDGNIVPGFRADIFGALFLVSPGEDESVLKLVPAAEAGMTLDFLLGGVRVNSAMDVAVFCDGNAFLFGFTPRFGLMF